ncbi:MAG: Fic family protein [Microthrixaceae bacterium]
MKSLVRELAENRLTRSAPTVAMACDWHATIHSGLNLPDSYYAGNIRDSDPKYPCLIGYEVVVAQAAGVASAEVPDALTRFERQLQAAIADADSQVALGSAPTDPATLQSIVQLAATIHGEWVRIQPFANANGRTARIWANWCALRFGLPPFVRLRPRPTQPSYGTAAMASMLGDHGPMGRVFLDMLHTYHHP